MKRKTGMVLGAVFFSILAFGLGGFSTDGNEGYGELLLFIAPTFDEAVDDILGKIDRQGWYSELEDDITGLLNWKRRYLKSVTVDGHSGLDLYERLRLIDKELANIEDQVCDPQGLSSFISDNQENPITWSWIIIQNEVDQLPTIGTSGAVKFLMTKNLQYVDQCIFEPQLIPTHPFRWPHVPTGREREWLLYHAGLLELQKDVYMGRLPPVGRDSKLPFSDWYIYMNWMDRELEWALANAGKSDASALEQVTWALKGVKLFFEEFNEARSGK